MMTMAKHIKTILTLLAVTAFSAAWAQNVADSTHVTPRMVRTRASTHSNNNAITLTTDEDNSRKTSAKRKEKVSAQRLEAKPVATAKEQSERNRDSQQVTQVSASQPLSDEAKARIAEWSDTSQYKSVQLLEIAKRYEWHDDEVTDTEADLMEYVNCTDRRYMPKNLSMDKQENVIFLYFDEDADGHPGPLHLRLQHSASTLLHFDHVAFQIDYMPSSPDDLTFTYGLQLENIERGKTGKKTSWQHSDNILRSDDDKVLLYALSHCNWALLTLKTDDNRDPKLQLSDDQLRDFYVMLQLFKLKGGVF